MQTYRWDVLSTWPFAMHKRPLLDADLKDYCTGRLIPTTTIDTPVVRRRRRRRRRRRSSSSSSSSNSLQVPSSLPRQGQLEAATAVTCHVFQGRTAGATCTHFEAGWYDTGAEIGVSAGHVTAHVGPVVFGL